MIQMLQFQRRWRSKMQPGFGEDFRAARQGWRYKVGGNQVWWMAVLLAIAGFVILSIFQTIAGAVTLGVHMALDQSLINQMSNIDPADQKAMLRFWSRDIILGIGPAAIAGALAAWGLAGIGVNDRWEALNLRRINLGAAGWIAVLLGFTVAMLAINATVSMLLHLDEKQIGVIEQAMADMRAQPLLYAVSLPGIMIFTPIVEELIFRGAVFHALLTTPLGKSGTVIVTAALWAVIHGVTAPWVFVGIIFLMGIVLGVLLLRFGSLWVTIACHATWNLLTAGLIFGTGGGQ
jgi:uncharacterized protein